MFGNDILYKKYIFLSICIVCIIIQGNCKYIRKTKGSTQEMENQLAVSGHLYDIFRKRLENFGKELVIMPDDTDRINLSPFPLHNMKEGAQIASAVNAKETAEATSVHKNIDEVKISSENKNRIDETIHANFDKEDSLIMNEDEEINNNDLDSESLDLFEEINFPSAEGKEGSKSEIKNAPKNIEEFEISILPNENEEVKSNKANKELPDKVYDQFRNYFANNINDKKYGSNQVVGEVIDQFEENLANKNAMYPNPEENPILHENIKEFKDSIANKSITNINVDQFKASSSSTDEMNGNIAVNLNIPAIAAKNSNTHELETFLLNNVNKIHTEMKDSTSDKANTNEPVEANPNKVANEMLSLYKDYFNDKENKNADEEQMANELADDILNQYKNSPAYKENKVIEAKSKEVVDEIIDKFEHYKKLKGLTDAAVADDKPSVVPKSVSGAYEIFKKSLVNIGDNEYNTIGNNLDKLAEVLDNHNSQLKINSRRSRNIFQDQIIARRYLEHYISQALKANKKRRYGDYFLNHQNTFSNLGPTGKLSVRRRQMPNNIASVYGEEESYPFSRTAVESSFPNVFTRESYLGALTTGNLLSTIAKEMNMTNLDVAKKLTAMGDLNSENVKNEPKLCQVLQTHLGQTTNLIKNDAEIAQADSTNVVEKHKNKVDVPDCEDVTENTPVQKPEESVQPKTEEIKAQPTEKPQAAQSNQKTPSLTAMPEKDDNDEKNCEENGSEIPPTVMVILDKVLENLERLQNDRCKDDEEDDEEECPTEGTPCNLGGLWNSHALGIAFDISIIKRTTGTKRTLSPTEKGNLLLNISPKECDPPKRHHPIIDLKWSFMGSTLKELGGPFYMYTQPHYGNKLATFVGYCRVCGGIDTIFGSWSFALPSTDCQNIVASFENKADIMRRNNMEAKRVQRYKNILFAQKFPNKNKSSER